MGEDGDFKMNIERLEAIPINAIVEPADKQTEPYSYFDVPEMTIELKRTWENAWRSTHFMKTVVDPNYWKARGHVRRRTLDRTYLFMWRKGMMCMMNRWYEPQNDTNLWQAWIDAICEAFWGKAKK